MKPVYDPSAYNNLPLLSDAGERFDVKRGHDLIDKFRVLFQQHGVDREFGLILNHRHFDMSPTERIVEYHGTSVPWETMLDNIRASTWLLSEQDDCLPYEFYYPGDDVDDEIESPSNPKYSEFTKSFNQILRQNDALGLFGLCRYPGDDFEGRVEITEGRANINLRPQDAPKYLASREASWFFSPTLFGKCVCICGGNGHTRASHRGHVPAR